MGLFDKYPYTNLHELNLDWIIKKLKDIEEGNTPDSTPTPGAGIVGNGLLDQFPYTNLHELNLDWIISKIKNIEDGVQQAEAAIQAAEDAAEAKEDAEQAAEDAEGYRDAAEEFKNDAQDYADNIADPVSGLVTTWLTDHITNPSSPPIDTSLTIQGAAADAKATGDAIRSGVNFRADIRTALLNCFAHVAWIDANGQTYYDALQTALGGELTSITAVYTQGDTVIYDGDSLRVLTDDLVVTAHYNDSSSVVLDSALYTLSGSLETGTSTITVTYGAVSTTFTVTVTAYWDYKWDYTDGLPETDSAWTKEISGTASSSMTADGLALTSNINSYIRYKRTNSDWNVASGVMSVTFNTGAVSSTSQNIRLCLSNGTNGIQIYAPWDSGTAYFVISIASGTFAGNTQIGTYTSNTDHTIKFTIDNGYADIELDGVQVASNVDVTTVLYSTNTCIMSQNAYGGTWYLKSIKFKDLS